MRILNRIAVHCQLSQRKREVLQRLPFPSKCGRCLLEVDSGRPMYSWSSNRSKYEANQIPIRPLPLDLDDDPGHAGLNRSAHASRLTDPEYVAWRDRLKRDGPKEIDRLFDGTVRAVATQQDEGKNPAEIAAWVMGDYYDAEYLTMIGPVFRREAIVLLEAMVRQAIELESADGE
jgi:hypothetical protein